MSRYQSQIITLVCCSISMTSSLLGEIELAIASAVFGCGFYMWGLILQYEDENSWCLPRNAKPYGCILFSHVKKLLMMRIDSKGILRRFKRVWIKYVVYPFWLTIVAVLVCNRVIGIYLRGRLKGMRVNGSWSNVPRKTPPSTPSKPATK